MKRLFLTGLMMAILTNPLFAQNAITSKKTPAGPISGGVKATASGTIRGGTYKKRPPATKSLSKKKLLNRRQRRHSKKF